MKLPKNTELWAISVESPQASDAFKKSNHAKGRPISFPLLWDEDNKIINAFGLLDPRYKGGNKEGIPYASTYVINKKGLVTFAHFLFDYSKRPSNLNLLSELQE